jgi:hypothetical protein
MIVPCVMGRPFLAVRREQGADCASAINRRDKFATVSRREKETEEPAPRHRGAARGWLSVPEVLLRGASENARRSEIARHGSELR